ncbi:MAG TPA: sulfate ABC transporter ATP-binding protein [Gammaproteobacteria bacterium]|nr:sulfate ABC transporter ATP-binding protein [Gammaproteobacteria bacterium]
MSIEIRNVTKKFGHFKALDNVSLDIDSGELVALLGPSGSGKTTLLRAISGLEKTDWGTIHFYGADATGLSVHARQVGFVFQHYALFRHMTVFENIAFGLRVKPRRERPSEKRIAEKVHELLNLVQLDWLADRYPAQLSGGQRQRIALARALAVEPKVLLLDEPFGALDAKVRKELRRWLRRLHDEIHVTSVFVTHDQEEAMEVADRVVIMNHGRIEQIGTPDEVYANPATPFVYHFLGDVNLFHGRVNAGRVSLGDYQQDIEEHGEAEDAAAIAFVRPHDLELSREPGTEVLASVTIEHIQTVGPRVRVEVRHEDQSIIDVELTREQFQVLKLQEGEHVYIKPKNIRVFLENAAAQSGQQKHFRQ